MSTDKRPDLGQWCIVSGIASKTRTLTEYKTFLGEVRENGLPCKTTWESGKVSPRKAMYIGWRRMAEGITTNEGEDYYHQVPVFSPTRYIEVWIFVADPRENYFYVLPEDAQVIEND